MCERGRPEGKRPGDTAPWRSPEVSDVPPLPAGILALQAGAGNALVSRALASGIIQRAPKPVPLTGIKVSPDVATVPVDSGVSHTAQAVPSNATDVTFSLVAGSAAVKGTTVDASTGAITAGATQEGGTVKAKADQTITHDDGSTNTSSQEREFRLVEKPTGIASTVASGKSSAGSYGAEFTHTFSSAGKAAGMEGGRVNEKFDSLEAEMPWGGTFKLAANSQAASAGWGIDSSGAMTGPDSVTIGSAGVDARQFVKSASNPSPKKTLPQSFTMVQKLRSQRLPAKEWEATHFATVSHVRGLQESGGTVKFVISAGGKPVELDYVGPAAVRRITATPSSVEASPPKPKAEKGKPAPAWKRNEVQVTADVVGDASGVRYSITQTGESRLGCEIDATSGLLKVGDRAGSITVRATAGTGTGAHFDEASVTITAPPAPPAGSAPSGTGGGLGTPEAAPGEEE